MRKALVTLGLVAILACGGGEGARTEIAARVDGWDLTVRRLAELLVLAQPFPLEPDQVTPIVSHWVDMAAFARRTSHGDPFLTRDLILRTQWNEVREGILAEFRAREFGSRIRIRPEDMDSLYFGDEVRAVAHMLRRVGPEATDELRRDQLAWARETRARLVGGAPWSEANQVNQDVESHQRGGLMLVRHDQGLQQISEVAFSLRPGELSDVFASPQGYHILVRPRLEEVRNAFTNLMAEEEVAAAEATFVEALAEERNLEVLPDAADILRGVASDPLAQVESTEALAEFTGGTFTAGQAARLLHLLPLDIRPELMDGPDWGVEDFARQLALLELLWTHVHELGNELSDSAYGVIQQGYEEELSLLWGALEIVPETFTREDRPLEEREASAHRKLDLYLEFVVARTKTLQSVPPFLAMSLLGEVEWEIDSEGLQDAIATARRLLDLAGFEEVRE